jgi:hypothetical protein
MSETFVELRSIQALRVKADWKGGGPASAFATLESKLPTLKGRKFYGVFREVPEGEEYFACVERAAEDDPAGMGLETGEIPGGWYARRKIRDWAKDTRQMGVQFREMIRVLGENVDRSRPEVEFYRSHSEVLVFEPVRSPGARLPGTGPADRATRSTHP